MANERLRSCITGARLTISDVAAQVGVDPKTVERWIVPGRVPHRSHRWATASLLGTDEAYLWPEIADDRRIQAASAAELVTLTPTAAPCQDRCGEACWMAPPTTSTCWSLPGCSSQTATQRWPNCLPPRPSKGSRSVSLWEIPTPTRCVGGERKNRSARAWQPWIRLGLMYLQDAISASGVELRFHATTLYNSIYRFDDDMLVNAHVYGAPAAHSPVLHLRRLPGGRLVDHYQASFERVWDQANGDNLPRALMLGERRSYGSDRLLQ